MSFPETSSESALEMIEQGLERALAGIRLMRVTSSIELTDENEQFDPRDPNNKFEIGGLQKLTPRGIEICYRLFDAGKTRYSVASLMNISFGAATHRYHAWEKAGGINREKADLSNL